MERKELIEHAADLILKRSGRLPVEVKGILPGLTTTQRGELIVILGTLAIDVLRWLIKILEEKMNKK